MSMSCVHCFQSQDLNEGEPAASKVNMTCRYPCSLCKTPQCYCVCPFWVEDMESPLMTPANESQQQGALEKALEEDWGRNAAQRSAYEPQKHPKTPLKFDTGAGRWATVPAIYWKVSKEFWRGPQWRKIMQEWSRMHPLSEKPIQIRFAQMAAGYWRACLSQYWA